MDFYSWAHLGLLTGSVPKKINQMLLSALLYPVFNSLLRCATIESVQWVKRGKKTQTAVTRQYDDKLGVTPLDPRLKTARLHNNGINGEGNESSMADNTFSLVMIIAQYFTPLKRKKRLLR